MSCRDLCLRIVADNRWHRGFSPYASGLKYCRHCEVWLKVDGIKCPCCRKRLRMTPVIKRPASSHSEHIAPLTT